MNAYFEKLLGNIEEDSLQHKVLNISILIAIFSKILALSLDLILAIQWQAILFSGFTLSYFIIFYFIARYHKNYKKVILFLVAGVFILHTPISWFVNEGVSGNTIYSFFIALVATHTLTEGKWRVRLLVLAGISLISIITLEYYFPEYIISYPNRAGKYVEIGVISIVAIIVLSLYFNIYYYAYLESVKKLKQSNQELLIAQAESIKQQRRIHEQNIELIKKTQDLEKANATKDRFYTIIAHDLKSPFNTIIGFSDLIKEEAINNNYEKIKKYSDFLIESSEQTYKLLLNLLDWTRVQNMDIEYRPEKINIKKLIEEQISIYKYMAISKKNHIESSLEECFVFADKNMLKTVVRNLLSNAIKYTENGKISIKLCHQNGECLIKIEDTGVGIKLKILKDIFNSIEIQAGTKGERGSGIGLKLCKEFIEINKGKLKADSVLGKGSIFYFTLPVYENKDSIKKQFNKN